MPFWDGYSSRYIEPFMGSACLFFSLEPACAVLGDINQDLVDVFLAVQSDPDRIYERLANMPRTGEYYYRLRAQNALELESTDRAARFIYLNRLCFNGLHRTNGAGRFNVPYAGGKTGAFPTLEELQAASRMLRLAEIKCLDFEALVVGNARRGDLVYMDPPYARSDARVFREYTDRPFAVSDLSRLRAVAKLLDTRGARFVISYAKCREVLDSLGDWQVIEVKTQRNVSGFTRHRRAAEELIISNFEVARPLRQP